MRTIPLTQGKVAVIDDCDYERVSKYKWHAVKGRTNSRGKTTWYARRAVNRKAERYTIKLHNFILGVKPVDHFDGDGLNNRRSNLRPCTYSENQANASSRGGTSRFKGVSWNAGRQKWSAAIGKDGKDWYIGLFDDEEDAAVVVNVAYQLFYGGFALLNDV